MDAGERARNRVRGLGEVEAREVERHRVEVLHLQSRLVAVLSQWRVSKAVLAGAMARGGPDMAQHRHRGGWEEWREWDAECRRCREDEEECLAALQGVWDEGGWQGSCPRFQGDVCCVMCTRGCGALRPCWGSNLAWPQGVVRGVGGISHCGGLCVHAPVRAAWHTSVRQGALAVGARRALRRAEAAVVEAKEVAERAAIMAVETAQYAERATSQSRSRWVAACVMLCNGVLRGVAGCCGVLYKVSAVCCGAVFVWLYRWVSAGVGVCSCGCL